MIVTKIELPDMPVLRIKPLADVHYGNSYCDLKAFKAFLADVDENTYFLGVGDILDSIIVKDKRYSKSADATESDAIINAVTFDMINILTPYRDKILGLSCLSSDTLVLTENGWKSYDQLLIGESVLSLDTEKNVLEYKKIEDIISYPYNGDVYHLQGYVQNQIITPDHTVLYQKRSDYIGKNNKKYWYDTPENLPSRISLICPLKTG